MHEYVDSAAPVGSQTLVKKYNLLLSAATIRNEMARLEGDRYISHPHTSAGRVPSDRGYRYFVEWLMGDEELSAEEKARIRHQFHQVAGEVEGWGELAAAILSQTAQTLALVTAPRSARSRLKHIELLELNERTVLMVVVLQEARVRQRLLNVPEAISQEALSALSTRINQAYAGLSEAEMMAPAESPVEEAAIVAVLREMLRGEDEGHQPETFTDGLENVLAEPEFARSERAVEVIEAVDDRNLSRVIPFERLVEDSVLVSIGAENRDESLHDFSVVVSQYGVRGSLLGAIGIVGPTRMRYPRMISTVRYMAEVMSDLVAGLQRETNDSEVQTN